mmetsp:Transcript_31430/g.76688  ORF Transcript_31430/g.76688 Transcript_31430/m.76688 type:complete len:94 (-) Transcript_31430:2562-2843(-)
MDGRADRGNQKEESEGDFPSAPNSLQTDYARLVESSSDPACISKCSFAYAVPEMETSNADKAPDNLYLTKGRDVQGRVGSSTMEKVYNFQAIQ